ncbi:hypothetical protein BH20ACT10_BH20ACT10_00590 [soil metagenome]|jgi:hypothetical protein
MIPPEQSIPEDWTDSFVVLFRILGRRSWDNLQSWHRAFPNSYIEHLLPETGFYVLIVDPGLGRVL